jgi:hypothetical protein
VVTVRAMGELVRGVGAGLGVIDKDFAFRGNKAANKLRNLHDHGAARGAAGTNRTKRADAAPGVGRPAAIPTAGARYARGFAIRAARTDIGGMAVVPQEDKWLMRETARLR